MLMEVGMKDKIEFQVLDPYDMKDGPKLLVDLKRISHEPCLHPSALVTERWRKISEEQWVKYESDWVCSDCPHVFKQASLTTYAAGDVPFCIYNYAYPI